MMRMRHLSSLILITAFGCGGHSTADNPDVCSDSDGDGQTDCDGDCNDGDPSVLSGGTEICGDGRDNNCDGVIDDGCNGLGTWVSGTAGNDTNPGTQAQPVATIAKGLANAATIGGGQDVYVAGGHYPEKVVMVEGTDIHGGYACAAIPCSWAHDPVANDTAILDIDHEGVVAPSTITRATKLDGFRIVGFAATTGTQGAAISISGAPTIYNNRIFGGMITSGTTSAGIALLAPTSGSAMISNNDITLGTSTGSAFGISFTATAFPVTGSAVAEVRDNLIHGGTASSTAGISAGTSGTGTVIIDNDIVTGSSTPGAVARGGAWGIRVGGTATIDMNRINVPPATPGTCGPIDMCGGMDSSSATATITNNVVYGPPTAQATAVRLREVEVAAGAVVLNSNYLNAGGFPASSGTNQTFSAAVVLEYTGCGACGVNAAMGKIRNNILDGGKNMRRYGVFEANSTNNRTNRPQALENNLFYLAPPLGAFDFLYHQWNGTVGLDLTTIVQVNAITTPPAAMNLTGDPLVNASGHLTTGSPCINKGTATEAPATDLDGAPRTNGPPDIGADEM